MYINISYIVSFNTYVHTYIDRLTCMFITGALYTTKILVEFLKFRNTQGILLELYKVKYKILSNAEKPSNLSIVGVVGIEFQSGRTPITCPFDLHNLWILKQIPL